MKNLIKKNEGKKQWTVTITLVVGSALALLPLLSPSVVQAAPPDHAPANGYRNKKDKQNQQNQQNQRNNGTVTTVTGTVTQDAGGNQFWVKGDDGRGYLVSTRYQSSDIAVGARVSMTGYYDGQRFIADSVRVISSGYQGNNAPLDGALGGVWTQPNQNPSFQNGNVNFPCVIQSVTYDAGVAIMSVRGDDNRTYNVRYRTTTRFRSGQRVRVDGRYNDGWVWATTVR